MCCLHFLTICFDLSLVYSKYCLKDQDLLPIYQSHCQYFLSFLSPVEFDTNDHSLNKTFLTGHCDRALFWFTLSFLSHSCLLSL